jgi:acyl-lipid (8-3)-desaturase
MTEVKNYTWEQVEQHSKPEDAWVSFEGEVFDVTEWAKNHPGGSEVVEQAAGKDITDLFICYHKIASVNIFGTKSVPKVGKLTSNKFPIYSVKSGFYSTLKQKVENYFKENNIKDSRSINAFTALNVSFIVLGIVFCYFISMYTNLNIWYRMLAAFGAGLFHHLMMVHPGHDVSHNCLTRYALVWKVFADVGGILLGMSNEVWMHRHVFGHHIFTNVSGIDPDLGIYKASPKEELAPYRGKHIIMPGWVQKFAYLMVCFDIQVDDFYSFFRGAMEHVKINDTGAYATAKFLTLRGLFFVHRILLPLYLGHSLRTTLFLFAITELTAGLFFGHFSQISHIIDDLEWPADTPIEEDWGEMQVRTSCDYATDSVFWTYLSGHLNYQTCHHLFPSIQPLHYEALLPLVKETCKEYNVKYTCYSSFWETLSHHYNHLKQFEHKVDCTFIEFIGFRSENIKTVE